MSVIVFILKIIGIILLALLGILLALLGLVLFVPVRYRIGGSVEDEIAVWGQASFMLHLIGFRFSYQDGGYQQQIRICGIRTGKRKKEKHAILYAEEEDDAYGTEDESEDAEAIEEAERQTAAPVRTTTAGAETSKEPVPEKKQKKRQRIWQKIQTTVQRVRDTLFSVKDRICDIKSFIADETNKKLIRIVWKELRYLLGHFKFRRIDTDLRFSLKDPANTGQALGILSMIPWLYRYQIRICPDFESEQIYVKGVFDIKGRVRLIHVLVSAIRLLSKKECRTAIKKFL